MSGLVVGYGSPDYVKVEEMFKKISYRGPYLSGILTNKNAIMAQNYLRADCPSAIPDEARVPISSSANGGLRICYDGQMGNADQLVPTCGISAGPFAEERILLNLYQQYGSNMFQHLDDAIFAFVISDGEDIFAARDLLGIKTLFYGRKSDTLYLTTELKSLVAVTDDINE
ncbi:MAG: hypothetical protein PVI74_11105, partial [Syntrophobacterales bacterium]